MQVPKATTRSKLVRKPTIRETARAFKLPAHINDDGLAESLGAELLSVCIAALKSYGLSSSALRALASRVLTADSSALTTTSQVLDDAQRLAEAVNRWGEDPAFLDSTGSPALLSRNGSGPSFATLASEYFAGRDLDEVIRFGCDAGVMERVSGGRLARLNNCVVLTGNPFLMLAHSVRTVRRFLATANHNKNESSLSSGGWPDRGSYVDVSDQDFAEFVKVMRQQIVGVVELSNRWLVHRAGIAKRTKKAKRRIAGVHAFLFRE